MGYSASQPSLFKRNQLEPVKDLKLLVKDYGPIAKNALTMLVNISDDPEVLHDLATDDQLLESLLLRITVCQFTYPAWAFIPEATTYRRPEPQRTQR